MKTFILHCYKTNEEIHVGYNGFRSYGSSADPFTQVEWIDNEQNKHSATVKETFKEVNEAFSNGLKNTAKTT
ncbi:MAG: hypothetical protein K2J12_00215 [Muribaculaceae bacterium]|nr:hypothetical protein [Muribaculaceae bacterium]